MIKINNRLSTVASFVDESSTGIIDVGCDHALLSIYLKQKYPEMLVIASDINLEPLKKAEENIEKYSLSNKIKIKLASGIDSIEEGIDTVIISGMGCETIIGILNAGKEKLNNVNKLILSCNGKYEELRKKVLSLGYFISKEKIVYEEDKFYVIIEFLKGSKSYSLKEFYFGPYLLKNKDEMFYKYYNYIKEKKELILGNIPDTLNDKKERLYNEVKMLTDELQS